MRQRKLDSFHILVYGSGFLPLSASLPTFFATKKVGAARPERKESNLNVIKHQSGKASKCTQGFYREPLLACGFPNRASYFSGPPSPSCPFGRKGVSPSAEGDPGAPPPRPPHPLKRLTKLLGEQSFCVTQQFAKKDGRGILKGESTPSQKYIKGFPLERFFAHFLCDKESGGRAA